MGLLCSVKCPGSVILRTFDLMGELADEELTVVSGFHSPMENECRKILLRGTCGVAICYARSLPKRIPGDLKKPIDEGRLLLVSAFEDGRDQITKQSSTRRNRLVAHLGDVLFVPYASPDGMVEGICREAIASGRQVLTFDGDPGASLRAIGAKAIPLSGVALLVRSLPDSEKKSGLLLDDSNARRHTYSVADIRRNHLRAYEKWTDQDEALLLKLHGEGKSRREIAQELQRQPSAISSRLRKIERRITQ